MLNKQNKSLAAGLSWIEARFSPKTTNTSIVLYPMMVFGTAYWTSVTFCIALSICLNDRVESRNP